MPILVSVVVVSRDRPDALYRCVLGLSQVQYAPFEIVVVADTAGLSRLERFQGQVKMVPFDEPNISAARNLGISHSAGEVVAFIDDDAVPEPTWLSYLTAPFSKPNVSAVGGFVLGRNGISFQWTARVLDENGFANDIAVDASRPTVLTPPEGQAVKTEGTNMAVRRDVLVSLDGFDPAYYFYLDETDLNVRLARGGHSTAIAPLAQVHHGFAPSRQRRMDRVPRDLFDIGASWAVFQRKFITKDNRTKHWKHVAGSERSRLLNHMIAGGLEPQGVRKLLNRLSEGYEVGKVREIVFSTLSAQPLSDLLLFPSSKRNCATLTTRPLKAGQARADARNRVTQNCIVTLLILSPTALFHRVSFHSDGYWEQAGGLFGKSVRNHRLVRFWNRKKRTLYEEKRVYNVRSKIFSDDIDGNDIVRN